MEFCFFIFLAPLSHLFFYFELGCSSRISLGIFFNFSCFLIAEIFYRIINYLSICFSCPFFSFRNSQTINIPITVMENVSSIPWASRTIAGKLAFGTINTRAVAVTKISGSNQNACFLVVAPRSMGREKRNQSIARGTWKSSITGIGSVVAAHPA